MKCSRKKKIRIYVNLLKNNVIFYRNWLILKDFFRRQGSFEPITAGSGKVFPGTRPVIILLCNVQENNGCVS